MKGIKDFSKQIDIVVNEITENYILEKNMLPLGYKILRKKNYNDCITLSDNFYYFSDAVKQLYNDINTYFTAIETSKNELCLYASKVCDMVQIEVCEALKQYYKVA